MVEFGDRLRKLRKERKLTQKELASLIGVKNSVISFYEVGTNTVVRGVDKAVKGAPYQHRYIIRA